jgi:hypothetical protein
VICGRWLKSQYRPTAAALRVGDDFRQLDRVDVEQVQPRPFVRQAERNGAADSRRGARHERGLSTNLAHCC